MSQLRFSLVLYGALTCVGAGATCLAQETPAASSATSLVPEGVENTLADRCMSLLGLAAFIGIAWLLSTNRKRVDWRLVAWGTAQQFIVARARAQDLRRAVAFFQLANDVFNALTAHTVEGAKFLFGNLVWNNVPTGAPDPQSPQMSPIAPAGDWANTGAFFAFNVLPTIIFFSSLMTLLYHWGLMQWVVRGLGWCMSRTMKISGAESLSTAGNIFLGQTEAPAADQAVPGRR